MFEPFPALDSLTQAATLAATLVFGGTVLGIRVNGFLGLSIVLAGLLALAFRAALLLQRELDVRPTLSLSLRPDRAYQERTRTPSTWLLSGQIRLCAVTASVKSGEAARCEGRIVGCQHRVGDDFQPLEAFKRAIELPWLNPEIDPWIDIEPDVPEELVVCLGSEEKDAVYLGTEYAGVRPVALSCGEYRIRVRLRPTYDQTSAVDKWFRLRHFGAWDEVELAEDQS